MSAFQREVNTGRIGPIVGTLESVRIIKVSVFRGICKAGFHCTCIVQFTDCNYLCYHYLTCMHVQLSPHVVGLLICSLCLEHCVRDSCLVREFRCAGSCVTKGVLEIGVEGHVTARSTQLGCVTDNQM